MLGDDTKIKANCIAIKDTNNTPYALDNWLNGKILWTNPNPANNFAAQTITLNSSDYDMYEILFTPNNSGSDMQRLNSSGRIIKGYGSRLSINFAGAASPGANVYSRIVDNNTDTALEFSTAYVAYGSTSRTENTALIVPQYVIGYKQNLS